MTQGKSPVLILEGFLLFSYAPLLSLIEPAYRFFVCVDGFTCSKRRFSRHRRQAVPDTAMITDGCGVNGLPSPDTNWYRHNDFFMSIVWPAFLHCNAHIIRWAPQHWLGLSTPTATPTSSSGGDGKLESQSSSALPFTVSSPPSPVALPVDIYLHPLSINGAYCSDAKGPSDDKSGRLPESRWTPGTPPSTSLISAMTPSNRTSGPPLVTFIDGGLPLMVSIPHVIAQVTAAMKPTPTLQQLRAIIPDLVIVGIGGASGTGKTSLAAYAHVCYIDHHIIRLSVCIHPFLICYVK
jgi:hypothetical protein